MYWLVKKSGGGPLKVALPDAVVPGEAFEPLGLALGATEAAVWHRTHGTLVLTDDKGLERNVRVRASTLQSFEGEVATQVALEFLLGAPRGVRAFNGTVEPFVPGQASRGKTDSAKGLVVRSQITGKVLKIMVAAGDRVSAGDALMIVEAMKMENRIFAAQSGVVATIAVKEGDSVATGKELARLASE